MNALPAPAGPRTTAPEVDRLDFRNAMARLGAAVTIVTTDGPGGRAGFAATAVCSVTDDPPTLLVCLNRASSAHAAVRRNGRVCINVLAGEQADLSRLFGGRTPMVERFGTGTWTENASGTPELEGALVSIGCEIVTATGAGTHEVLFCRVLSVNSRSDGGALIYVDRSYREI
ncbi:FMN reductase [Aureimonas flava]|uniref:FMN reductase n=1 Tax=Aureimonas flava TaxID=2320271 RepID=A0A3A1WQZ1_9HYPH|nr:flavin reductase [Aureimonas flava]RIY03474.1 FMN reductase [Aureimonas flava]